MLWKSTISRPPDRSVYCKIIFFFPHPKHMLKLMGKKIIRNSTQIKFPYLDLRIISTLGGFL